MAQVFPESAPLVIIQVWVGLYVNRPGYGRPVRSNSLHIYNITFVGMHVLLIPGRWDDLVVHLIKVRQSLRRLLEKLYAQLSHCICTRTKEAMQHDGTKIGRYTFFGRPTSRRLSLGAWKH
jgi:hypothetical protein